jgi:4-hydroxybenzoate-CoA ligase
MISIGVSSVVVLYRKFPPKPAGWQGRLARKPSARAASTQRCATQYPPLGFGRPQKYDAVRGTARLLAACVERGTSMLEDLPQRRPYNAVTDLVDAPAARGLAGKTAFIDGESALTYGELQARSCRFGSALLDIGLRPEERLALLLYDTVDFPVAFWGSVRAGVVVLPLNTLLTAEQYAYILGDSRAAAIVASASLLKTLQPVLDRLPRLRSIIVVGGSDADRAVFAGGQGKDAPGKKVREVHDLSDLLARGRADIFTALTQSDEVAFWLYTSGSTGEPKGVKHVHTTLLAAARLMGGHVIGIREDDVAFSAAKLFFSYGMGNAMAFPLSVGATTVLLPQRPTPEAVFETMRRHRPTIFYGVPTLYASLLAHKDMRRGAGSDRLRLCISAGEPLPRALGERWRDACGVDVLDGIGSTEMFQTFLSNSPGDVRYGTTGKTVPGYELKILDEGGHELADGEIGELVVRGATAGEGYWNQRAKSRRTFAGEWTFTGDKYFRDRDGYYHYCGRTDDMFKVSGMWVSPFEVEAALASHEAVLEAAVIGKADADGLIKPKAFIVLRNGFAADERLLETLRVHVKECAGPWKYPRWIDIRPDLPRTATGKIQRFKLRELES